MTFLVERRSFLCVPVTSNSCDRAGNIICMKLRNYFKRYPGLPVPMDLVHYRQTTGAYVAAYTCAFHVIIGIITNQYGIVNDFPNAPIWVTTIYKVFAISVLSATLLPIFISVTYGGVFCWFFGACYCLLNATISLAHVIRSGCMGLQILLYKVSIWLPTLLGYVYLFVYFCDALYTNRDKFRVNWFKADPASSRVHVHKNVAHVRHLLSSVNSRNRELLHQQQYKKGCCKHAVTLFRQLWFPEHGFTYPAGLLWSLTVSVLLQYFLIVQSLNTIHAFSLNKKQEITNRFPKINSSFYENVAIDNARRVHQVFDIHTNDTDTITQMQYEYIYYSIDVVWICIILATSLAFITNVINAFRIMFHYQTLSINIYRNGFKVIPEMTKWLNAFKITRGTILYPSYQVALMACGYYLQTLLYIAIFIFLSVVVTLNAFTNKDFLVQFLRTWWPGIIIMTAFGIIQQLVIRFLFTQHRGRSYGFNNVRSLQLYNFFSSFYNVFFGLISGFGRVLYCPVSSALCISRLDISPLGKPIQSMDTGYVAFLGFLYADVLKNNPTFRTGIWALLSPCRQNGTLCQRNFDAALMLEVEEFNRLIHQTEEDQAGERLTIPRESLTLDSGSKSKVHSDILRDETGLAEESYGVNTDRHQRRSNRNRWQLAYTLIRNKELITFRNRCGMAAHSVPGYSIFDKLGSA
ncbi:hypothetical protein PHET_08757 [Paragonimus heterotremus]|uniref:Receptor for retinol uptake STRA6 n=1 Tax=Paragonimus heterotremus TaxID=100268 RepID=A0A8J4T5J4_9TREM|nr:hypothetical protein PHET_08757 [Paragonimus heterotremus]